METLPLQSHRKARGLTRQELADLIGVSVSAVQKAETTDPRAIGLAKYLLLSRLWGVSLKELGTPPYRLLTLMETST